MRNEPNTPLNASKIENLQSFKEELKKNANALKRKSNILWPSSSMNSENRTRKSVLKIANRIENEEKLTIDQSKGVLGKSVLLVFLSLILCMMLQLNTSI